jgi:chromosome segregation ATPase
MNEQQKIFSQVSTELIERYHQAVAAITENSRQVAMLSDKVDRIQKSIPRLEAAVGVADGAKTEILASHAINNASDDQLRQAREECHMAAEALKEESELLVAVKQALTQAEDKVSFLNQQKQSARVKIFQVVSELTIQELRNRGQELFYLLDASARVLGGSHAGTPFEGLHPSLAGSRIKQFESELFGGAGQGQILSSN